MYNIRLKFRKKDSLKYISHLDLNRLFTRMINRSGIKVWYSEGFNPHPYIVFSPPISVGMSSECEIADIRLTEPLDESIIIENLNKSAPTGIEIISAKQPKNKIAQICYSVYNIKMKTAKDIQYIEKLKQMDNILVAKKSKSKEVEFDISPYIKEISNLEKNGEYLSFTVQLPSSPSLTVKASLVVSVIEQTEDIEYKRLKFLDQNLKDFD